MTERLRDIIYFSSLCSCEKGWKGHCYRCAEEKIINARFLILTSIILAAKKVGHFIKTTGAKVAKFGLKVVETAGKVIGKAVGFLPGIGKPLGKAIEGASKVAGVISDRIKVKLPKKLEKGVNVMDKINKVTGFIPRRREFSEEEIFQQRDIDEAYFEERDDIALENREISYFEVDERDIYERYYDLDEE